MKEQANLERHLCIFVEDGHIKYQSSKQMLQHGGSKVPVHLIKILHEEFDSLKWDNGFIFRGHYYLVTCCKLAVTCVCVFSC